VFASLNQARAKARDTRRMSDINEINKAIQLYILDNGHAPYLDGCDAENANQNCFSAESQSGGESWNSLEEILSPRYISSLPRDPSPQKITPNDYDGLSSYGYYYADPSQMKGCVETGFCSGVWGEDSYLLMVMRLETRTNRIKITNGFGSI
jgi:type II secretory pathway pseudopilin PulG